MIFQFLFLTANLTDPCNNYTVLNDSWRYIGSSQPPVMCDTSVSWSGWYRLFINNLSAQIPDTCFDMYSCGTAVPLWISGGHPTVKDGIVNRSVCSQWCSSCCYNSYFSIRVKACPGNYSVYELISPLICSAYCVGKSINLQLLL